VIDSIIDLEKVLLDARKEFGGEADALRQTIRHVGLAAVGALTAALAHAELRATPDGLACATGLCERAGVLARRARAAGSSPIPTAPHAAESADEPDAASGSSFDEVAHKGFALGLRKVDHALSALGR